MYKIDCYKNYEVVRTIYAKVVKTKLWEDKDSCDYCISLLIDEAPKGIPVYDETTILIRKLR